MERGMIKRAAKKTAKLIPAGMALVVVLIGAEYVRAAASHRDTTGTMAASIAPADLVAAELDPVFMQKLTDRSRRPYQRSHPLNAQP
jgi:hypothetical protein